MVSDHSREINPKFRRRIILLHAAGPVAAVLIAWIIFALYRLFGIEIASQRMVKPGDPDQTLFYLVLAIAATVIGAIVGVVLVRKALSLARDGVEVIGVVTQISSWSAPAAGGSLATHLLTPEKDKMRRAECQYQYQGASYSHAWSHVPSVDGEIAEGDEIVLLVDPKDPKRSIRKNEVFVGKE